METGDLIELILFLLLIFALIMAPILIYAAYDSDRKKRLDEEIFYTEIIDSSHTSTARTDGASAIGRGFVGGALLGPVGLAAGVASAKKRVTSEDKTTFFIVYNDGTHEVETVSNKSPKYNIYIEKIGENRSYSDGTEENLSISDEIIKAKELLDNGIITAEEYQAIKNRIIN